MKDYGLPEYARQMFRQNKGMTCEHCGSALGHTYMCPLLNREAAERQSRADQCYYHGRYDPQQESCPSCREASVRGHWQQREWSQRVTPVPLPIEALATACTALGTERVPQIKDVEVSAAVRKVCENEMQQGQRSGWKLIREGK